MTIHRFLVQQAQRAELGDVIRIADRVQIKQIRRVLRLGPGDHIDVVTQGENAAVFHCRLLSLDKTAIVAEIVGIKKSEPVSQGAIVINVLLSLLKGGRFENCLAKLTEIGIDRVVPLDCTRTVAKVPSDQLSDRLRRWSTIVNEATEQCERLSTLEVGKPVSLFEALNLFIKSDKRSLMFLCCERSQAPHLITLLDRIRLDNAPALIPLSDISVVIGPEGGLTAEEIDKCIRLGCIPCSLGDNILRADTAAITAAYLLKSFGQILGNGQEYQIDRQSHI